MTFFRKYFSESINRWQATIPTISFRLGRSRSPLMFVWTGCGRRKQQLPTEDIEEVVDNRLNPEDHYIAGERLELIRQAVRELPEDYRVPVILFHQQGFSYEALVEITGQPMTVIKNRLHRARLMLKDKLNPDKAKEKPSC